MTDAELAILSIIAEGPIYGYDIQTIITQRGLRAWTNIGVSSMYYVLEKLERQGLIESKGAQHLEGAARRQYRITPAGFGVLQTAVADLLSTPREHANDFELGLANLYVLRPTQIRTAFITYRQELVSRLAQARERWRKLKDSSPPFNVDAMLGHHVALLEAELAWIKNFIEEWEAQAPPDESPALPPEPAEVPRMKQVVLPHDPDSPHRVPTRSLDRQPGQKPGTEADTDLNLSPMPEQTPPGNRTPSHPDAPSESERNVDPGDEYTSEEDPDRPDEP
jgi:DNA-binding PadR family transcriptional regulator